MKILLLAPSNSTHTQRWANALTNKSHEVYVVSCKDHLESDNSFVSGVKVRYLKYPSGLGYYLNAHSLKRVIKEISPDVINVHYASGYGTLARVARVKKYLLNIWGSDVFVFPKESRIKRRIIIKNLKYPTLLASTSHIMAKEASNYTNRNFYITPFGVDLSRYKKPKETSKDNFIFCTVKSLEPVYGIKGIIDAFELFLAKVKDDNIEYHIYGKGSQYDEINEYIKSKNLENKIFLKGFIKNDKVPDVLASADIFLLNSKSESFGVAAVEAMASYKPVIASNAAGFLEVIEDGVSGVIVEYNNINKYVEAMLDLYNNEAKRKMLGDYARKRVEELYDWNKNVDSMINVYKDLIRS